MSVATVTAPLSIDRRTVNLDQVARELGVARRVIYDLARKDSLPVPVIRIGERRMVVSRQALDDLLASPLRPNPATDAA